MHISLIFFVSTIAFIASEYANSFIIAKLKALTSGNFFVLRAFTAITTAIILDSIFMLPVINLNPTAKIIVNIIITLILIKILYEVILMPFTWGLTHWLKKKEGLLGAEIMTQFSSVAYITKKNET